MLVCHGHGCIANHKLIGCKGDSCRRGSLDDARKRTLVEAVYALPLPYLLKTQSQRLDCILRNSGTIPAFSLTGVNRSAVGSATYSTLLPFAVID
jgi:hypothetical protein